MKRENFVIKYYGKRGVCVAYIQDNIIRYLNKNGKLYSTTRVAKVLASDENNGAFKTREQAERALDTFFKDKEYMIVVQGNPKKIHTDLDIARTEAKRLAIQKPNMGKKVRIVEVLETYQSELTVQRV